MRKPVLLSASASAKRRHCEFWRDFLAFRPIVVGVALEAARFCVLRPRRVTRLASRNPRQQNVGRLRTRQCLRVATHASESLMRTVIELRMRHPPQSNVSRRHGGHFRLTDDKVGGLIHRGFCLARGCDVGCAVWVRRRPACDARVPQRGKAHLVTLCAGLAPEQLFGDGGLFCYPLRGCDSARSRWPRPARQGAIRILHLA